MCCRYFIKSTSHNGSHSGGSRSLIMDHHDIVVFSLRYPLVSMVGFSLYILYSVRCGRSRWRILLMGCMWARLELPAQCLLTPCAHQRRLPGTTRDPRHGPPTSPLDAHGQVFASSKRADTQETATGLQVWWRWHNAPAAQHHKSKYFLRYPLASNLKLDAVWAHSGVRHFIKREMIEAIKWMNQLIHSSRARV